MRDEAGRILRFAANGLAATAVHYGVLVALVETRLAGSVAAASALAAICGVAVSYCGNRRFVLRSDAPHARAAPRFLGSYAVVVGLHGALMALWADAAGLNYSVGFVLITAVAAVATYCLNRFVVFTGPAAEAPSSRDGSAGRRPTT